MAEPAEANGGIDGLSIFDAPYQLILAHGYCLFVSTVANLMCIFQVVTWNPYRLIAVLPALGTTLPVFDTKLGGGRGNTVQDVATNSTFQTVLYPGNISFPNSRVFLLRTDGRRRLFLARLHVV